MKSEAYVGILGSKQRRAGNRTNKCVDVSVGNRDIKFSPDLLSPSAVLKCHRKTIKAGQIYTKTLIRTAAKHGHWHGPRPDICAEAEGLLNPILRRYFDGVTIRIWIVLERIL